MKFDANDTIAALATPQGTAAIAVIRLSGKDAVKIVEQFFYTRNLRKKSLQDKASHTIHFGVICHNNVLIDEVLVSLFHGTASYTGQPTIEISCHGSTYIQQQLLQLFLASGARMANPGEFTLRAFLNHKLDLSQAEAVHDLITSNSQVSHRVAMQQMRGGFSNRIAQLREQLVNFASLIELELDFSEEDVEFADRSDLRQLVVSMLKVVSQLLSSFELGNVIKTGIPVAIVGKPNAGKSTLLNVLLEDERAIVSEIAGTTRDTIEDEIILEGVLFRFIDTAGLRSTADVIEQIGVNKAYAAMKKSAIVIYLFDARATDAQDLAAELKELEKHIGDSLLLPVGNKTEDLPHDNLRTTFNTIPDAIFLSAKTHQNINLLKDRLLKFFTERAVNATDTIVTNARHAQSLKNALIALQNVERGLDARIAGDLLALDIRYALEELGNITGQVTNEDLLENIFSRFCIGK